MNYQEKKILGSMAAGLVILILYLRQTISTYTEQGTNLLEDTAYWAKTMLLYIGFSIVAIIIFMILLHILMAITTEIGRNIHQPGVEPLDDAEDYFDPEDEMDRLINLKAGQVGYVAVGIGFVGGLITLAIHMAPGIMMNILFLSFLLGSLLEGAIKIYFYRRGVSNG